MEKQNNNKGIITLLILIIVILATLCVLLATETISFNSNKVNDNYINENINNNENNEMTNEEALVKVKEIYKKFNDFDHISLPAQLCGESESINPNNDSMWYVKSIQFKNKEDIYNYYSTLVSRELIDKKINKLESGFTKSEQFPSSFLEKDGALYCLSMAAGGFNYQIIDDKTTYKITKLTPNKIIFTGNITTYLGYEIDISEPYDIEATLELIDNNWVVTQNIKK